MSLLELFLIAIGLSMDAFAVAICIGLSIQKESNKSSLIVGLYFGFFQAVMPLIGYLLASQFAEKINGFVHWIAFILLALIGIRMIKNSFKKDDCGCSQETSLSLETMLPLSLATSIDALAVGVSFAFLKVAIIPAISFIGLITLLLSILGVKIGNMFCLKFRQKAEFAGGAILVLMAIKVLI